MNFQNKDQDYHSNCPISGPILYPSLEIKSFNGLAWSNVYGMIHQSRTDPVPPFKDWIPN